MKKETLSKSVRRNRKLAVKILKEQKFHNPYQKLRNLLDYGGVKLNDKGLMDLQVIRKVRKLKEGPHQHPAKTTNINTSTTMERNFSEFSKTLQSFVNSISEVVKKLEAKEVPQAKTLTFMESPNFVKSITEIVKKLETVKEAQPISPSIIAAPQIKTPEITQTPPVLSPIMVDAPQIKTPEINQMPQPIIPTMSPEHQLTY